MRAAARAAAAPALVSLALFLAVALLAGREDGFRFCAMIRIGHFVDAALLAPCARQQDGPGYDGQFYFAIAHDPFLARPETAASLDDSALRYRRILYPLAAWLLAGGDWALLPATLVAVNVLAAAALVAIAAVAAARAGRSPWWSLGLAAFGGVWMPVARDLTEPLQLALLAAAMVAGSATLGALAAFAKETAAVALVTEAARAALARDLRRALRFGGASAVFLGWVLAIRALVHGAPESSLEGQFLRPPGAPLLALAESLDEPARFALLAAALAMLVLAIVRVRRVRDGAAIAAVPYAILELGAGYDNWHDPVAVFRSMAGAVVLVFVSWCVARDRAGLWIVGLGAASGATSAALFAAGALPR